MFVIMEIFQKNAMIFQSAEQWLNAGKTEKAIQMIEGLISTANLTDKFYDPNGRALYNKLALCYLRLGEQQNCIQNHTPYNCIIPLQKEGFHTDETGSKRAIEIYTELLKVDSNNEVE